MINHDGDTPMPSVFTDGFAPPFAGPTWEGSNVEVDTHWEGEARSETASPFFVTVFEDSGVDKFRVEGNTGVIWKHWSTDTITPSGLGSDLTRTGDDIIIEVTVSGGVIGTAEVKSGTYTTPTEGTEDTDGSYLQTKIFILVARVDEDDVVHQNLHSHVRLLETVMNSQYMAIVPFPMC